MEEPVPVPWRTTTVSGPCRKAHAPRSRRDRRSVTGSNPTESPSLPIGFPVSTLPRLPTPWDGYEDFRSSSGPRIQLRLSSSCHSRHTRHTTPGVARVCTAVPVSYARPLSDPDFQSNFVGIDYLLVRWLERHAYDVSYITDYDFHLGR